MARSYHSTGSVLLYLAILTLMTPAANSQTVAASSDAYLDPKNDPNNPLKYIASNTLTAIAFALAILVAHIQAFYTFRYGGKYMLAMVIGGFTYASGFGCRFLLHNQPDSEGIYIAQNTFIVLSPCAFIAANYVLFGRVARHLSCPTHVLLPVQKLTLVFVSSDITTFLIQVMGAGLTVSHNQTQQQLGSHIFLAGLALQLVSFTLFSGIYIRFLYRVYTLEHNIWERDKGQPWSRDWRTLAAALAISCIGILVRSCYRVAELSQGFQGYLATTEAFFYALDTLPLIIAISVYALFWPGWIIKDGTKIEHEESGSSL
ncbi:RTA1-domain-containing protein [Boletus coccyginus]|nr:RTA1-domain-containing protein [Boletus coccyginus]